MYTVTYEHHLKPGKSPQDFTCWMNLYWQLQQSWGATGFSIQHMMSDKNSVIQCTYYVKNVKQWINHAIGDYMEPWLIDLEKLSELNSITIRPESRYN